MTSVDNSASWTFAYNADGLRIRRSSGSRTYGYTYLGDRLSQMTVDGHALYFSYDAWGKLINIDGTATNLRRYNPLRYRGYVYDTETGLYYVSSRYYDPEIGRFINADDIDYLGADGFMTGGLCALGGSVVGGATRTIKYAKSGITIGKTGQFEKVAELAKTRHYSGLKEFNLIKKVAGQKAAETVGWWQNKCVVKGVMTLKGPIYDCGGALTGAYAKELALTKGYHYLYNVWLM